MIPLFTTIPHSGLKIPPEADWLQSTSHSVLNCDVDFYVDDLYQPALEKFKIPFLFFPWHRYAVDVNRFAEDIFSLTVEGAKPRNLKSPSEIHWYQTTKGDVLIQKQISKNLHNQIIEKYFKPFHQKIKKQIETFKKQGQEEVYLLDLHSMPSQGLDFHRDSGQKRPDIVLGTNEGLSSNKEFAHLVLESYQEAGFKVAVNWPYKGGAITQLYGKVLKGQNVIQVEINRSLYMDEITKEKTDNFFFVQGKLREALKRVVVSLS